jgi:hypothetical protein
MQTIAEYQSSRAHIAPKGAAAIPEVRHFARRHVESLQADGHSALVLKQLCREAQSSRRVSSEAALMEHADEFNVGALQAGLEAFRTALDTGKKTARKVSKIEHKGGKFTRTHGRDSSRRCGSAG